MPARTTASQRFHSGPVAAADVMCLTHVWSVLAIGFKTTVLHRPFG